MRKASAFNVASIALGLAFLYLPIAILMIYSFNGSRLVTVWGGWSARWYVEHGFVKPARVAHGVRRKEASVLTRCGWEPSCPAAKGPRSGHASRTR